MKKFYNSAMRSMRKYFIPWVSLCLLLPNWVNAQQVHISHCLKACPAVSKQDNEIALHHLYAASIVPQTGLVEWVAYKVLPDSVGVASLLPRYWMDDELLDAEVRLQISSPAANFVQPDLSNAQDREYRISEVQLVSEDRGRLAPLTSFAGTPYWAELNLLSNMSTLPQPLRVGAWSGLDQAINELAALGPTLYVVTGPVIVDGDRDTKTEEKGAGFFKAISDGENVASFLFDADLPPHAHFCAQLSTLDRVESAVSLVLFPGIDSRQGNELISQLGCGDR